MTSAFIPWVLALVSTVFALSACSTKKKRPPPDSHLRPAASSKHRSSKKSESRSGLLELKQHMSLDILAPLSPIEPAAKPEVRKLTSGGEKPVDRKSVPSRPEKRKKRDRSNWCIDETELPNKKDDAGVKTTKKTTGGVDPKTVEAEDLLVVREEVVQKLGNLDDELRDRKPQFDLDVDRIPSRHEFSQKPPIVPPVDAHAVVVDRRCKLYETNQDEAANDEDDNPHAI